jgi:hypothetical protein
LRALSLQQTGESELSLDNDTALTIESASAGIAFDLIASSTNSVVELGLPGTPTSITIRGPAAAQFPTLRARADATVQVDTATTVQDLVVDANATVLVNAGSMTAAQCTIDAAGAVSFGVCP